ncbi:4'-phosphopantetheinyl transferase superfamily protein [Prevotella sp. tf2-5]|uniref:4'-phosphopantetheinyl transferase family protein n=1 Tax=Prevotella sp. tf2-5 TaxID=1761889 RepID=UPI0008EC8B40|nr:4'-phosphopantetheinyl transferase superfamily protein [Prevotella sp. tf2-5]SFO62529.1 4'-phosphopantetheinyl transferase [Prevotella sp. tf2-5]
MIYLNDDIASFDFEAALPLLSDQRREQALKFKHELGRKTCAAAYLLLCEGLRKEYGIHEKPVFEYGEHGKPYILGHTDIHFNFSHCREAVLCVISDHPVGCDIESIREYKESLARYTMNDTELTQIKQSNNPAQEFIRFWTMKEAVLKLSGEGIRNDMKTVLTGRETIETVVNERRGYVYSII